MEIKCYRCSSTLELETNKKVSRHEECPKCFSSVHCCKMCAFYDPRSYNECKEPVAQRVLDKEKNNFCEFFKLGNENSASSQKTNVLSAAEALFKK